MPSSGGRHRQLAQNRLPRLHRLEFPPTVTSIDRNRTGQNTGQCTITSSVNMNSHHQRRYVTGRRHRPCRLRLRSVVRGHRQAFPIPARRTEPAGRRMPARHDVEYRRRSEEPSPARRRLRRQAGPTGQRGRARLAMARQPICTGKAPECTKMYRIPPTEGSLFFQIDEEEEEEEEKIEEDEEMNRIEDRIVCRRRMPHACLKISRSSCTSKNR